MSSFKLPTPHPTLSRNGFDLSSRRIFSAPAGALLPVLTQEVNPGEHFSISVQDLVRTQPLNTAAFARCKEYYHFFFVPYRALWSSSDRFFTGVTNGDRSYKSFKELKGDISNLSKAPKFAPNFDLDWLVYFMKTRDTDLPNFLNTHGIDPSYNRPFKDALGFKYDDGVYRLLNLLEFGVRSDGKVYDVKTKKYVDFSHDPDARLFSMFRPLAYQRIYNDFYRNQQWEKSDPTCFNVDYLFEGGTVGLDVALSAFQLRYRYWQKDWLTSALPSVLYNEGIFHLPTYTNGFLSGTELSVEYVKARPDINSIPAGSVSGITTVADIKASFALEKMLEATRRANGLDYSSQIAAHYGFKVPESRRDCAQFIGGFDNTIGISEVISTANGTAVDPNTKASSSSVAGQMFGKGIGSMNSGKINFDVKEHGLIMCIYSIAPQVDYNAEFLNPFNRKLNRMDYFQPEFQNLGLQPILQSDLGYTNDSKTNNSILGYTSRYAEYKTSRDVVFGEFQSGGSLSAWTTPRKTTYTFREDNTTYLSLSNFLVDPNVLSPIFSLQYDGTPKTDQFMINSYFDIKAVRPMSVVGSMNL